MPFDGSDYGRLRAQITRGDYYEPPKPSAATGLIRDMLQPCAEARANIDDICEHWWLNAGYRHRPILLSDVPRPNRLE